jgi:hypothetical protein
MFEYFRVIILLFSMLDSYLEIHAGFKRVENGKDPLAPSNSNT